MHEHFDVDGNKTGHTVITRESAWDDSSRGRALRLAEYEATICKCGCGLPIAEAHIDQTFAVETFKCYAGRAMRLARKQEEDKAKREKRPDGWDFGLHYAPRPVKEDQRGN